MKRRRHVAPQLRIARAIRFAHSPRAQTRDDLKGADAGAGLQLHRAPLRLRFRAPEAVMGAPLGDHAVRHPAAEALVVLVDPAAGCLVNLPAAD